MTAQEEIDMVAAANNTANADDEDLPEGMAAQMVRPAAAGVANLANQFANWANMGPAATNQEEEKKGENDADNEEQKK